MVLHHTIRHARCATRLARRREGTSDSSALRARRRETNFHEPTQVSHGPRNYKKDPQWISLYVIEKSKLKVIDDYEFEIDRFRSVMEWMASPGMDFATPKPAKEGTSLGNLPPTCRILGACQREAKQTRRTPFLSLTSGYTMTTAFEKTPPKDWLRTKIVCTSELLLHLLFFG